MVGVGTGNRMLLAVLNHPGKLFQEEDRILLVLFVETGIRAGMVYRPKGKGLDQELVTVAIGDDLLDLEEMATGLSFAGSGTRRPPSLSAG